MIHFQNLHGMDDELVIEQIFFQQGKVLCLISQSVFSALMHRYYLFCHMK